MNSIEECIEFSNEYAPEHLILSLKILKIFYQKLPMQVLFSWEIIRQKCRRLRQVELITLANQW